MFLIKKSFMLNERSGEMFEYFEMDGRFSHRDADPFYHAGRQLSQINSSAYVNIINDHTECKRRPMHILYFNIITAYLT